MSFNNTTKGLTIGVLILAIIITFTLISSLFFKIAFPIVCLIVIWYICTHKNDQQKEGFDELNNIVILSDIHIDPMYDYTKPNGINSLWKSKVSPEQGVLSRDFTNILNCGAYKPLTVSPTWPGEFDGKESLKKFQLYKNNQFKRGADPPIMLLYSALENIKNQYNKKHSLFFCGDSIAHNIDDNVNLSKETFKYTMRMMANSVKRGRFFPAIGNNDGIHDNEFRNDSVWNTLTSDLFKELGVFDNSYGIIPDINFFTTNGYYIKGFDENTIVISINTQLFGKDATQSSSDKSMIMLNRLDSDLKTYSSKNVYIIGHYPPSIVRLWSGGPSPFAWGGAFNSDGPSCGIDSSGNKLPPCNQIFLNIVVNNNNNRNIFLIFGHTHIDQVGIDKSTGIKWITSASLTGSFSGVSPAYISLKNNTKEIETNYLNIQNGDDILDAKWINNKGLIMPPMKDPCLENNCQLCDGYPQG